MGVPGHTNPPFLLEIPTIFFKSAAQMGGGGQNPSDPSPVPAPGFPILLKCSELDGLILYMYITVIQSIIQYLLNEVIFGMFLFIIPSSSNSQLNDGQFNYGMLKDTCMYT